MQYEIDLERNRNKNLRNENTRFGRMNKKKKNTRIHRKMNQMRKNVKHIRTNICHFDIASRIHFQQKKMKKNKRISDSIALDQMTDYECSRLMKNTTYHY